MTAGGITLGTVNIRRGMFQGDSLYHFSMSSH